MATRVHRKITDASFAFEVSLLLMISVRSTCVVVLCLLAVFSIASSPN